VDYAEFTIGQAKGPSRWLNPPRYPRHPGRNVIRPLHVAAGHSITDATFGGAGLPRFCQDL